MRANESSDATAATVDLLNNFLPLRIVIAREEAVDEYLVRPRSDPLVRQRGGTNFSRSRSSRSRSQRNLTCGPS